MFSALPLLAASLSHDPRVVSLLEAASAVPWLIFGLHAGVIADRLDHRRVMYVTDILRLVTVGILAALVAFGGLSVASLLALVFVLGTLGTVFGSASPAMVPSLVPKESLARANARIAGSGTTARGFIGPVAGSVLFGFIAWMPFLLNALSFGASATAVAGLPRHDRPREPANRQKMSAAARDGVRWIYRTRQVRVLALATALLSIATAAFMGCFVLFVLLTLHLPQFAYGILIAVFACGGLSGSFVAASTSRRLGLRWTALLSAFLGGVLFIGIGAVPVWPVTALCLLLLGVVTMVWNISTVTMRQTVTPRSMLGRVSSLFGMIGVGTGVIGAPVGGLIAKELGLPTAFIMAGGLGLIASLTIMLWYPADAGSASPGSEAPVDSTDTASTQEATR